jgi:uncharacterized protein YutE (UPF0331/DUF86 family)
MNFRDDPVWARLQRLEEIVTELSRLAQLDRELLRNDLAKMWSVERGLQLGAEIVFDIGNYVLSALYGIGAQDYRDILHQLGRCEVVNQELNDRLEDLPKLRDILVHDSMRLDPERVLEALDRAPGDFTAFSGAIRRWMESRA